MARTFVAASSQKLVVASVPLTAPPCTFAAWWRPVSAAVAQVVIEFDDTTPGTNNFGIRQDATGHIQAASVQGGTLTQATTSTTLTAGVWSHACAVFASATDRRAFLNGGGKGTDATSNSPASISQCQVANGPPGFANGNIAECVIWNIALADADVALLATGVSPYLIHPEALKFYAPLLHGFSPEIELMAGRNLTVTGATVSAHPAIRYRGQP